MDAVVASLHVLDLLKNRRKSVDRVRIELTTSAFSGPRSNRLSYLSLRSSQSSCKPA